MEWKSGTVHVSVLRTICIVSIGKLSCLVPIHLLGAQITYLVFTYLVQLITYGNTFFLGYSDLHCNEEQEVNEHHLPHLFHPWLLLHLARAQLKAVRFASEQASDLMQAVSGAATDLIHLVAGKEPQWSVEALFVQLC